MGWGIATYSVLCIKINKYVPSITKYAVICCLSWCCYLITCCIISCTILFFHVAFKCRIISCLLCSFEFTCSPWKLSTTKEINFLTISESLERTYCKRSWQFFFRMVKYVAFPLILLYMSSKYQMIVSLEQNIFQQMLNVFYMLHGGILLQMFKIR